MSDNWYRLLIHLDDSPGLAFGAFVAGIYGYPNVYERDRQPIKRWDSSSWISNDPDNEGVLTDQLLTNEHLVIVSERVQSAMQESGIGMGDVQFLPIHVRHWNGGEVPGYCVMNILPRIEAIDRESSYLIDEEDDIDPLTGKKRISAIGRPHVYVSALGGHDVVRPLDYSHKVFVSERFAKMWEKGKFTGAFPRPLRKTEGPVPEGFQSIRYEPATII